MHKCGRVTLKVHNVDETSNCWEESLEPGWCFNVPRGAHSMETSLHLYVDSSLTLLGQGDLLSPQLTP